MKVLLLSLFFSFNLYAQDWTQITGCYKTIEYNGTPVSAGPNEDYSTSVISRDEYSAEFTELDKSEIPSINLDIFKCFNCDGDPQSQDYIHSLESIFLTKGDMRRNGAIEYKYNFGGPLFSLPWNSSTELYIQVTLTNLDNSHLKIHVLRKNTVAGPDYDRDENWLLERKSCPRLP